MIVGLFAGPGGWSEALKALDPAGVEVGIEWEPNACQTRRNAGHRTIRADVHGPRSPSPRSPAANGTSQDSGAWVFDRPSTTWETREFEQVGNAIPPRLAMHLLNQLRPL